MTDDLFDQLQKPSPASAFDGGTYEVDRDYLRLDCQLGKVFALMKDGRWRTIPQITEETGGSEAAISARLRDLRKKKYGEHTVLREYMDHGLFRYRLIINDGQR